MSEPLNTFSINRTNTHTMEHDWGVSSITRSCNPYTFCETLPRNQTTTITTTTNSTISPINTTSSCSDSFIFNQENNIVANTHTMENDWDLSSIVRCCKVTTFANPSTICETPSQNTMENDWDLSSIVRCCKVTTFDNPSNVCETPPRNLTSIGTTTTTNSLVTPINTTTSCFADFSFNQENSSVSFTQLKPNEIVDLNKLRVNFSSTTHIPNPTATSIPITVTTTTSSLTTATFSTHITPNIVTNINTNVNVSNQNSTSFDFSTPMKQHQIQSTEFTENYSFVPKFNPTTYIPTHETIIPTSEITTPTTTNHATIIPITTNTTITDQTTSVITHIASPTHLDQTKPQSRIRKSKTPVTSVCHVNVDKLSEDQWRWKKCGQKPIKGSPHSRSYYKCSSFKDCPARKQFEKSEIDENTYVVTYRGKHNHEKPKVKQNSDNGTSRKKSSNARLSIIGQAGSSQNIETLGYPNVVMVQFDQSECNNARVIDDHSTITNLEIELNESQSQVIREAAESSQNVRNFDSHNRMMLQDDEPKRGNAQTFLDELKFPYPETDFIGSSYDDDDILIPNKSPMLEDFLLDINHINSGYVLP